VAAHRGALRSIGVSPEEIRTIEADLDQAGFERKERALIRLALHANRAANDPADEVFAELCAAGTTDAEIVEALGVMEVFASFNRFLDILQVEIDF
jgi:alkylhydroperoxidase family enzyme